MVRIGRHTQRLDVMVITDNELSSLADFAGFDPFDGNASPWS